MRTLVRSTVVVVAMSFSAAACGEETGPPTPCLDDTGVVLAVATGASPRFNWSPACLAFRLGVTDSVGTFVWQIDADSGNTLHSGVTFGVVPDGATETIPAAALQVGQRYAVGLFRATGDSVPNEASLLTALAFRR